MKNVILIHGFNGAPKIYKWVKEQLEAKNIEVVLPSFPPQEGVVYEIWAKILDQQKDKIKENSIVVGHSIGNEFIIKYCAKNNLPIDTYIGLAGFAEKFYHEGKDILNSAVEKFLVSDEEKNKFIALSKKRFAVYSNDDHIVPFNILNAYPREIDAKPILINNIGHMGKKSGLEQLPKLLELIVNNLQ